MSNIQKSMDLLVKAHRVLDSCQTCEQYRTAGNWLRLAWKASWDEPVHPEIWYLAVKADTALDLMAMGIIGKDKSNA